MRASALRGVAAVALAVAPMAGLGSAAPAKPLVVHEWGTITSRHQPDGRQVGGLNKIDPDEVLPDFVHRYEPQESRGSPEGEFAKRAGIGGHPDVTLRLETPVLYVYPDDAKSFEPLGVTAKLVGGLINEYYPDGVASYVFDQARFTGKVAASRWDGRRLDNYIVGNLEWKDVRVGSVRESPPSTTSPIWLSPRATKGALLKVGSELEYYLFYRGVANLEQVLSTRLAGGKLTVGAPSRLFALEGKELVVPQAWAVALDGKGGAAYEELGTFKVKNGVATTVGGTDMGALEKKASAAQLAKLRESMKAALEAGGLYDDEAEAMLKTWESAYFRKAGLRLFYIVPRAWIDAYVPLELTRRADVTRVYIGRIDLVQ